MGNLTFEQISWTRHGKPVYSVLAADSRIWLGRILWSASRARYALETGSHAKWYTDDLSELAAKMKSLDEAESAEE